MCTCLGIYNPVTSKQVKKTNTWFAVKRPKVGFEPFCVEPPRVNPFLFGNSERVHNRN